MTFTRGQKNTYAHYVDRIICIRVVYQSMLENLKWERALKGYVNRWHMWQSWTVVRFICTNESNYSSRLSTLYLSWLSMQNIMHKRRVQRRYIYKFSIINVFTTVTNGNLTGGRTSTYFDLLWQPNYLNTCTCTNKHIHVYIYCLLL